MGSISPPAPAPSQATPDLVERIFIFSHPRTTSNVFLQFFAKSNEVSLVDCPFDAAYMAGPEKMCRRNNPKINSLFRKPEDYHTTYQNAFQSMQGLIRKIEAQVRALEKITVACVSQQEKPHLR